jgi:NADPH-dependent dioxygenase
MTAHPNPEVLVVGAGPVGLAAALFLQQHGVRVAIVDQDQRTARHSYALAIHPRTLRALDTAGLGEALIGAGRKVTTVACYEGGERKAAIDYSALDSGHPYLLIVRQSVLEKTLSEALRRAKIEVLWGHRLHGLTVEGNTVRAEVERLDQVAAGYPIARSEWVVTGHETLRPAYVIGADGYDSSVRRMAGIVMDAHGGGQVFSVYEMEAAGDLPAEVRVNLDPELTSVYWPLEDGRCRFGFQIRGAADHDPSMDRLTQLIAARVPWCTARPRQIYWSTMALFEPRLARSFGGGRVWLAGDAAHQAGPVGVHSMNSGLVEARDMAPRIARVLHEGAPPPLLDEFAGGMRALWQGLLEASAPGSAIVRAADGADPWIRRNGPRLLKCLPASGEDLHPLLAQVGLTVGLPAAT